MVCKMICILCDFIIFCHIKNIAWSRPKSKILYLDYCHKFLDFLDQYRRSSYALKNQSILKMFEITKMSQLRLSSKKTKQKRNQKIFISQAQQKILKSYQTLVRSQYSFSEKLAYIIGIHLIVQLINNILNLEMADKFCRKYVDEIFSKWDTDRSNVLSRQQVKNWLKAELKQKPFRQAHVKKGFYEVLTGADTNGDGKIDRWEMYEYCMNNYQQIN